MGVVIGTLVSTLMNERLQQIKEYNSRVPNKEIASSILGVAIDKTEGDTVVPGKLLLTVARVANAMAKDGVLEDSRVVSVISEAKAILAECIAELEVAEK